MPRGAVRGEAEGTQSSSSLLRGPGRLPCSVASIRRPTDRSGKRSGAHMRKPWALQPRRSQPLQKPQASAPARTPPSLLRQSPGAHQAKGTEGLRPASFWLPKGKASGTFTQ